MTRLKESYWLFGKEAVEFVLDNSDETKQKVDYKFIAAMIFDKMEYDTYMFEPTYPWDVDGILSVAMEWERYLEIDEELYAWLWHEEEGNNVEFKETKLNE